MKVDFLPCGDTALSVQLGDGIDRALNERIVRIKAAVDRASLSGVVETVPSYRALLVHYDPRTTNRADLIRDIEPYLEPAADTPMRCNHFRIPACYDGAFAPDLEYVAKWGNLTPDRVVEIHTSITHYVYMIGFAPGQPHMGDLPPELALPRRKDPRPRIEKGSVVIATGISIIYPFTNASGWHIIGRSPVSVFDADKDPPVLIAAGDTVEFFAVAADEFREIKEAADSGTYAVERLSTTQMGAAG